MKITNIKACQIFDSRGLPTIECEVIINNQFSKRASVPSGASTGQHEALELRDNTQDFHGKGVQKAIENIHTKIAPLLIGKNPDVVTLDTILIDLDDTKNKSNLGANATLAVSAAVVKTQAAIENVPLYELFASLCNISSISIAKPLFNIINGGAHADNNLTIQEIMVTPTNVESFRQAMQAGSEFFHTLKKILIKNNKTTLVGDEGGFAPNFESETQAFDLLMQAIEENKKINNYEFAIALDVAASEFYNKETKHYTIANKCYKTEELITWYKELAEQYPLFSIEDGLEQNDWQGWQLMTKTLGDSLQLVGDDIFVTNPEKIYKGIKEKAANAVLIKPNQIGTITETLQAIILAQENGFNTVISHRSGETNDSLIADLAVGTNAGQIKAGGLSRGERMAKYNQLLRIENDLTNSLL